MAATASLMKANKHTNTVTLGEDLILIVPHTFEALLQRKPKHWLLNTCATQTLLLGHPQVRLEKPTTINPATLLPNNDP